jgi:GTP cyclohydrolase II
MDPNITLYAMADLPTCHGEFKVWVFHNDQDDKEHVALTMGNVGSATEILVRVHSECLTGESLSSLRCDCREQLHESMRMISNAGRGLVVYLRQEGRGIGLGNKVKAYALQDSGMDTYEANHQLGFDADERDYSMAVSILKFFNVISLFLITNNPEKIRDIREHGIEIIKRVPVEIKPTEFSEKYLHTKRDRGGHMLDNLDARKANIHSISEPLDTCHECDTDKSCGEK